MILLNYNIVVRRKVRLDSVRDEPKNVPKPEVERPVLIVFAIRFVLAVVAGGTGRVDPESGIDFFDSLLD